MPFDGKTSTDPEIGAAALRDGQDRATGHAAARFYFGIPKRLFDLAFALLICPAIAPVVALLWCIVRLDGGPGFFGHTRIGKDGRPFKCYKLRSMVPDAEARLKEYLARNPEAAAQWKRDFKLDNDPRITRIGAFIRKTSLDELPQLWNVLRGDMSFVGPRPVTAPELVRYGTRAGYYRALRPGITGLWQVSGRNSVSYEERVAMDEEYFHRASFPLDVKIIARTATAVLHGTGQ